MLTATRTAHVYMAGCTDVGYLRLFLRVFDTTGIVLGQGGGFLTDLPFSDVGVVASSDGEVDRGTLLLWGSL